MAVEITLIRHGETIANAAEVWQGQGDSELSEVGRRQAKALGARLDPSRFDRVLSSDLIRTVDTATLAGLDPEPRPEWREVDIGEWEGLTRPEVMERFPDEMAALAAGESPRLGGRGETWPEFHERIDRAFSDLIATARPGERIALVVHGGVVHSVLTRGLGLARRFPWPVERIHNTAISRVTASGDRTQLQVLNDASHTDWQPHRDGHGPTVTFVRHGETEANVAGLWQGRLDTPLTERGRAQAAELASWHRRPTVLYSSPTGRAQATAKYLADGSDVRIHPDIVEIDFGAWEGLDYEQARAADPELWTRVYDGGEDLPRGRTGETFTAAGERMVAALASIAAAHGDGGAVAVSHGGSIRSLVARVLGIDFPERNRIGLPDNASSTTFRLGEAGPVLVDYNLRA